MTEELDQEVSRMCNLSTGLIEKSLKRGFQQGRQEGYAEGVREKGVQIYRNMLKRGFSEEEALESVK